MANCVQEIKYHCLNDCVASGCPSHNGRLEFQSTSNAYHFIMNGKEYYFEEGELQAMIDLLKSLDRADAVKL